ncbi:MAG TPA: hypothetical protein VEK12_08125 [Alphaproteobacteria bacterium]|nr:hypothetical protein [Alphaproteobacteria bacterium]
MRGTSDMHCRSAAHGSFARDDHSWARDLFDDPDLENPELSRVEMLRERAWLLAGCAAAVVAADVLGALISAP